MCFIPHFSNLIPFKHAQYNKKIIYILLWISGLIFCCMEIVIGNLWVFFRTSGSIGKLLYLTALIKQMLLAHLTVKFQCTVNIMFVWNDLSLHAKEKKIPALPLNVLRKYLHFSAVHWIQPCPFWLIADWNNKECCTDCCVWNGVS